METETMGKFTEGVLPGREDGAAASGVGMGAEVGGMAADDPSALVEVLDPSIADILAVLEGMTAEGIKVECEGCRETALVAQQMQEMLAGVDTVLHQINGAVLFVALVLLFHMVRRGVRGVFRND